MYQNLSSMQSPLGVGETHIDMSDSDTMQLLGMISNPFRTIKKVSQAMSISWCYCMNYKA